MNAKAVAIITARGGSKRIPHKNIREFCGRPIIEYSIKAALDAGCFNVVMVSTDDEAIAEAAGRAGAEVPFFRSRENSNDYAATADVLLEVLSEYERRGEKFAYGCCIYPTAPFVTADKLAAAMEKLVQEKADTVMPVVPFSFPPQRGMRIEDSRLRVIDSSSFAMRSQDLEKIYHDCGQFYCFRTEAFLQSGKLINDNVVPIIMDELEVQDIDNEEDWKIAEMKYGLMNSLADR